MTGSVSNRKQYIAATTWSDPAEKNSSIFPTTHKKTYLTSQKTKYVQTKAITPSSVWISIDRCVILAHTNRYLKVVNITYIFRNGGGCQLSRCAQTILNIPTNTMRRFVHSIRVTRTTKTTKTTRATPIAYFSWHWIHDEIKKKELNKITNKLHSNKIMVSLLTNEYVEWEDEMNGFVWYRCVVFGGVLTNYYYCFSDAVCLDFCAHDENILWLVNIWNKLWWKNVLTAK